MSSTALWNRRKFLTLAILLLGAAAGCFSSPQLAGDKDCLRATDALLTAVSAHDPALLNQCEQELAKLRSDEKLTPAAHHHLQWIITEGRSSRWKPARAALVKFIKNQRS